MCQFEGNLKLCTCSDEIDKTKPYWTLARKRDDIKEYPMIMGSFEMPSNGVQNTFSMFEERLNHPGGCFDFNYIPDDKDTLTLVMEERNFVFSFDTKSQNWRSEVFDKMQVYRDIFDEGPLQVI